MGKHHQVNKGDSNNAGKNQHRCFNFYLLNERNSWQNIWESHG